MLTTTDYSNIFVNPLTDNSSKAEKFTNAVVGALQEIYSTSSGRALLDSIQGHGPEKKLTISKLSSGDPVRTLSVLTASQLASYGPCDFSDNVHEAKYFAKAGGVGCSAMVLWSKNSSSVILHRDGVPKKTGKQSNDRVSTLAHELVHVKHIMNGSSMAYDEGDRYDPSTRRGQEESRAIGLAPYDYSTTGQPSENSVRAELGLPLRTRYEKR